MWYIYIYYIYLYIIYIYIPLYIHMECVYMYHILLYIFTMVQFSSVDQSCPTLCDPKDWGTPGFSVCHQCPELAHTYVRRVTDAIQPSMVHIYNGILLGPTKNENTICSNMDTTGDYHTKWSKSERKPNAIWYQFYVESKIWNKWTYLWNRNRIRDTENRLVVAKGEGGGREMNWEFGVSMYKPV